MRYFFFFSKILTVALYRFVCPKTCLSLPIVVASFISPPVALAGFPQ